MWLLFVLGFFVTDSARKEKKQSLRVSQSVSQSVGQSVRQAELPGTKPNLLCSFDPEANIYEENYMDFAYYDRQGRLTDADLEKLGSKPRPKLPALKAKDAQAIAMTQLEILNKVADRLGTEWWLMGGGSIGALRSRSVIPWDVDLDFCLKSKFNASQIEAAFQVQQRQTLDRADHYGLNLGCLGDEYADYVLVYDGPGTLLHVFHSPVGFKAEMKFDNWKCDKFLQYVLPAVSLTLRSETDRIVTVPIPKDPLGLFDNNEYASNHITHYDDKHRGTVEMPLEKWTQCYKCPNGQWSTDGAKQAFYIFEATGDGNVVNFTKWARASPGEQCEKVHNGNIPVVLQGFSVAAAEPAKAAAAPKAEVPEAPVAEPAAADAPEEAKKDEACSRGCRKEKSGGIRSVVSATLLVLALALVIQ